MPKLDVNDHIVVVGNFGRQQWVTFAIAGILAALFNTQLFVAIFTHNPIDHKCDAVDMFQNSSVNASNNSSSPFDNACSYKRLAENNTFSVVKCEKFSYASSGLMSTIVTEFDLVCDRAYLTTVVNILWMISEGFGAVIGSIISDRFGRKYMVIISYLSISVIGSITATSVDIAMYTVLRCIVAITSYASFVSIIALVSETFAPNKRSQAINGILLLWVFGGCTLAWLGYLLPIWRYLQLTISILALPVGIASIWLLDESPHWLMATGKTKQAYKVLQKMARMNRVEAPELDREMRMLEENEKGFEAVQQDVNEDINEGCWKIVKYPRVVLSVTVFSVGWISSAFGYYALSFGVSQLPGNIYINVFIMNVVEGVAYIGCFGVAWWGRKTPTVASYFLSGLALFISIFVMVYFPGSVAITVLSFSGKLFISAAWQIMGIWQVEVYPTTQKCVLVGINAFIGRIGTVIAPYMVDLHKYSDLPHAIIILPAVFVVLMIIAGALHLLPPETNKRKIPTSYEEANAVNFPFAREIEELKDEGINEVSAIEAKVDA